jgi:hypothetical protein
MNGYKTLSVPVDTSIGLKESLYYFRFRGVSLKYYVSQEQLFTDCLMGVFPVDQYSDKNAYKLLTEFLSLWSFHTDEIVIPGLPLKGSPFSRTKRAR